ncbi:hypothetical protein EV196_11523 [Mariniflexile fucanivorans]|uniref:Bacteriorhodopsin n=1 Tax=Mariniflexile fucanivorans TaxID=264023 RepID=A0A4R1R989_9FLAO|nr:hypothetical protein EV196_11523 [Mariniflexile fucanivorans]
MINFLLNNYELITYILEFLAAITGIFCFRKYQSTVVKYFIYFLVFVAFSDMICFYTFYVRPDKALNFLIGTKFEKNHWWSTLYWSIGAILFYVFYFYKILKTPLFKNILKYSGYVFSVFSLTYITLHWEQFFYKFFTVFDILGAIIICMCSIFYFTEILMSDKILEFYKSINFYISATIFIWWLIITPLAFYSVYYTYEVGKNFYDLDFVILRKQIFLFSNIFMYLTFTFAFIWCRPENN